MSSKRRLDVAVFEDGFCESRERARALIMAGLVYVNGQKADKAGMSIAEDAAIEVRGSDCPFVSRGGLKLKKAIEVFGLNVQGLHAIDIGASSGGFTDCLLQNGAERVYAVDVGHGQLAYKLRTDPRVVVFEKTNFRNMEAALIGEVLDIAVMDVSFISITKLVENLRGFLKENAECVFLIKPQFEAERADVGNGVIRDKALHKRIVYSVINRLTEMGYYIDALDYSPITGPKGNIEFISHYTFDPGRLLADPEAAVAGVVELAHEKLK